MRRLLCVILALSLIALCGCAGNAEPTTVPTQEPTAAPTTAPTEAPTEEPTQAPTEEPTEAPTEAPTEPPIPTNPLTGEVLDAPHDSRIFAVVINNVPGAIPMHGVSKADVFFEMFVNDYCTRGLALFSDIREANDIGSVRSLRYNFTDLAQSYDAVMIHARGSKSVLADAKTSGIDSISAGDEVADFHFRDSDRVNSGYAWEHCLFVRGPETRAYAESKGIRVTQEPDKDYGLRFSENATPADGEDAQVVDIHMIHYGVNKQTKMTYNPDNGMYLFNQFNRDMWDDAENQHIYFKNVIVMMCDVYNDDIYHVANLLGSGDGWFACGGKIIPIKWSHENMDEPILFTHTDGTPLELGVGSSYISVAPLSSTVEWE